MASTFTAKRAEEIADAYQVATETGLMPRQLAKQRDELLEACALALRWMQCGSEAGRANNMRVLEKAIAKAESKQ